MTSIAVEFLETSVVVFLNMPLKTRHNYVAQMIKFDGAKRKVLVHIPSDELKWINKHVK